MDFYNCNAILTNDHKNYFVVNWQIGNLHNCAGDTVNGDDFNENYDVDDDDDGDDENSEAIASIDWPGCCVTWLVCIICDCLHLEFKSRMPDNSCPVCCGDNHCLYFNLFLNKLLNLINQL